MLLWCWVFGDAYESDDFGQVGGLEEGYWGGEWVKWRISSYWFYRLYILLFASLHWPILPPKPPSKLLQRGPSNFE